MAAKGREDSSDCDEERNCASLNQTIPADDVYEKEHTQSKQDRSKTKSIHTDGETSGEKDTDENKKLDIEIKKVIHETEQEIRRLDREARSGSGKDRRDGAAPGWF